MAYLEIWTVQNLASEFMEHYTTEVAALSRSSFMMVLIPDNVYKISGPHYLYENGAAYPKVTIEKLIDAGF